ncbi:MAG TPA: hypothetical protein VFW71_13745 [Actinomycetota bacterium]|nr:hypothetical protein [Actinomycetota bacterium]
MSAPDDRQALALSLSQLMDRLCAPDLTLAEAQALRPRLGQLMAAAEAAGGRPARPRKPHHVEPRACSTTGC